MTLQHHLPALFISLFVLATLAYGQSDGEEVKEKALAAWLPKTAYQSNPGDDELTRLLKERYRAAVFEEMGTLAMIEEGIVSSWDNFRQWNEGMTRIKIAALDLCRTPADRIAVLQQVLAKRTPIEKFYEEGFKRGVYPHHVMQSARYYRLDAEIELLRAKREASKDNKSK